MSEQLDYAKRRSIVENREDGYIDILVDETRRVRDLLYNARRTYIEAFYGQSPDGLKERHPQSDVYTKVAIEINKLLSYLETEQQFDEADPFHPLSVRECQDVWYYLKRTVKFINSIKDNFTYQPLGKIDQREL